MPTLYERIMGNPWVYDCLRPWFLGGIDIKHVYETIQPVESEVILDVGCGTGAALQYLDGFAHYHGFDTDPVALKAVEKKYSDTHNITLHNRILTAGDVLEIKPNKVLLMGLLHHLSDQEARQLLDSIAAAPTVKRIISWDVYYGSGLKHCISNALARVDRGKFVRKTPAYRQLAKSAGFRIEKEFFFRSGNGFASYFVMCLGKTLIQSTNQ